MKKPIDILHKLVENWLWKGRYEYGSRPGEAILKLPEAEREILKQLTSKDVGSTIGGLRQDVWMSEKHPWICPKCDTKNDYIGACRECLTYSPTNKEECKYCHGIKSVNGHCPHCLFREVKNELHEF